MILADSSVWIANIRDQDTPQVRRLRSATRNEVIVGDLVALEVLRGVRSEREAAIQERRFAAYGITSLVDQEIVRAAAAHFRQLRGIGITIRSSVDLVIATYCIAHGHELLHQDRDFDPFERHLGLRIAG